MMKRTFLGAALALAGLASAAFAEETVTVYMPSPTGLNAKYVADFQKKTGIRVKLFEGTTGKILARLEAEKNNPEADVVVLASWSDGLTVKKSGVLAAYPQARHADKLAPAFLDHDRMLFGTSASALGVIYNTTLVKELHADWKELASPKYQGQLAIPDPVKSGSCKDFLAGYLVANGHDWTVWKNLAANGLAVAGANKAALEAVLTGEKAILVAGVDYNAYSNIKKGEPIQIYYPASGTVINPRPAMILKTAKHPENARKFVDYLLSEDAQKLVAKAFLLPGRTDVKTSGRDPMSAIPVLKPLDWEKMMSVSDDAAKTLTALTKANH